MALSRVGTRAVSAVVGDFQLETEVDLFGGLHGHVDGLAVLDVAAAGIGIDAELGVDEVAMLFDEPIDAVGRAAFLVGGEGEDEIAGGLEVFALHAQEGSDEGGVVALHVGGAAAVEVAALLAEDEGVEGPIGAAGFDDVEVSEEEDGTRGAGAAEADHEVAFAGDGGEYVDSACGESGGAEAGGHGFGGASVVAGGIGGIDLDELLEDLAGELLVGRLGAEGENSEKGGEEAHTRYYASWTNADYPGAGAGGGGSGGDTGGTVADSVRAAAGGHTDSGEEFEFLLSADDLPDRERGGVAGDVADCGGDRARRAKFSPFRGLLLLKLNRLNYDQGGTKFSPLCRVCQH